MAIYIKRCFNKPNVTIQIKKRFLFVVLVVVILCVVFLSPSSTQSQASSSTVKKDQPTTIEPEIIDTFRSPKVSKIQNIFFVESSCIANRSSLQMDAIKQIKLSVRQACAVESAALNNPNAEVYILHTCHVDARRLVDSATHVRELFSYPNVFAHHVDIVEFIRDTPLEGWEVEERLEESKFPVEHGSDIMRFVALWKYGGVYLDLDVVVLKSLSDLKSNFAGFESGETVACGVMSFEPGHELVEECLKVMANEYDPNDFSKNGPKLLTRTLMRYCHATEFNELTPDHCKGFTVYRRVYFYPIEYGDFFRYFDTHINVRLEVAKIEAYSYIAHMWNHLSKDEPLNTGQVHIYGTLAAKYCPCVYKQAGHFF